jgi:hypothetical protein
VVLPAFEQDEILTGESTRSARLKWVVVVSEDAPRGEAMNAVACISAATGAAIAGLLGPSGSDGSRSLHAGLPWAGCTILSATPEQLRDLRATAAAHGDMYVTDMPVAAQTNRVYDEYLEELRQTEDPELVAMGILGPRNPVDRLVKRLSLLA